MHPERGIFRSDRWSDVIYTRPDEPNTITFQSDSRNEAPGDPIHERAPKLKESLSLEDNVSFWGIPHEVHFSEQIRDLTYPGRVCSKGIIFKGVR